APSAFGAARQTDHKRQMDAFFVQPRPRFADEPVFAEILSAAAGQDDERIIMHVRVCKSLAQPGVELANDQGEGGLQAVQRCVIIGRQQSGLWVQERFEIGVIIRFNTTCHGGSNDGASINAAPAGRTRASRESLRGTSAMCWSKTTDCAANSSRFGVGIQSLP